MNPSIQVKKATPVFLVTLACFGLLPASRAVSPPPDGGYPGANTAEGDDALFSLTTGVDNTATGFRALFHNTIGSDNTAIGFQALFHNTVDRNGFNGFNNTAIGSQALFGNTIGDANTATGFQALFHNTIGSQNTAIGVEALLNNVVGVSNTATGFRALFSNTTGYENTANGIGALGFNTAGIHNTATGVVALLSNTTGRENTATGSFALYLNTTGNDNTANGVNALYSNTTGDNNTANGTGSLSSNTIGQGNTAEGVRALGNNTTGSRNIALGVQAGLNLTTGNHNIDIGNQGVAGESGQIRIGNFGTHTGTFIAGIRGATVAGGVPVVVGFGGQLGTLTSSVRFKEAIKPMDKASEAILALKPVTFRYKKELDPDGVPQFGLVAEDVEKVNADLVVRDEGELYTVRYDAVNAMLLNEFLKEHVKVEALQAVMVQQQKQIEALSAGLQKVSAEVQVSKSAPQTVLNNQ